MSSLALADYLAISFIVFLHPLPTQLVMDEEYDVPGVCVVTMNDELRENFLQAMQSSLAQAKASTDATRKRMLSVRTKTPSATADSSATNRVGPRAADAADHLPQGRAARIAHVGELAGHGSARTM